MSCFEEGTSYIGTHPTAVLGVGSFRLTQVLPLRARICDVDL